MRSRSLPGCLAETWSVAEPLSIGSVHHVIDPGRSDRARSANLHRRSRSAPGVGGHAWSWDARRRSPRTTVPRPRDGAGGARRLVVRRLRRFLWARRRANRLGPLMTIVGMLWLLGRTTTLVSFPSSTPPGLWLMDLRAAGFALFLLSFPTGRLTSRADLAIVGIFLFVTVPLELLWLVFLVPDERPERAGHRGRTSAAHVVDRVQRVVISVGAVLLVTRPRPALAAIQRSGPAPDGTRAGGRCRDPAPVGLVDLPASGARSRRWTT